MDDILEPIETEEPIVEFPEIELPKSRVYILTDEGRVVRVEGEYSLPTDLTDWILIDEGFGDKYNLAQSQYFEKPLISDDGTHNYIYYKGEVREATEEEKAAELKLLKKPSVSEDAWDESRVYAVGDYVIYNNTFYECLIQNRGVEPTNTHYWKRTNMASELKAIKDMINNM